MRLLRRLFSSIRCSWNNFAEKYHLRAMPVVPTIVILLILGLAIPLKIQMDSRATDLAPTLAAERLSRYAQEETSADADLGPTGTILTTRPAYYWPKHDRATSYRFTLVRDDGTPWVTAKEVTANYFLHDPAGGVQPGGAYRFTVDALDDARKVVRTWSGTFSVEDEPADLRDLRRRASRELKPFDRSLVLLGYYAEKAVEADRARKANERPSVPATDHDVVSALLATYDASRTDFRERMLAHEHADGYRTWLDRQLGRFDAN